MPRCTNERRVAKFPSPGNKYRVWGTIRAPCFPLISLQLGGCRSTRSRRPLVQTFNWIEWEGTGAAAAVVLLALVASSPPSSFSLLRGEKGKHGARRRLCGWDEERRYSACIPADVDAGVSRIDGRKREKNGSAKWSSSSVLPGSLTVGQMRGAHHARAVRGIWNIAAGSRVLRDFRLFLRVAKLPISKRKCRRDFLRAGCSRSCWSFSLLIDPWYKLEAISFSLVS